MIPLFKAEVVNIQNASLVPNMSNVSNVSNVSDVSDVSDFATLSKGFSNTTYVLVNVSNLSNPKTVTQQQNQSQNIWELVETDRKISWDGAWSN